MGYIVPPTLTSSQRVSRMFGQYRREIRYILLYAAVAGLINLSLPLGIQAIVSLVQGGTISAAWAVLVLFILVGAALAGILRLLQLSIMEHLQRRIFADSAAEFALRIPRLNLEALRKEHLPEIVNRFFDTITIQKSLPKLLIDGATAILTIVFSLLLLSVYHTAFVVSSLVLIAALGVLLRILGPLGLETSLKESKFKYKLVFWLEEIGRVATTFKLAGESRFPVMQADALTQQYLEARHKHWRVLLIFFISSVVFRVLVMGGFLILGSLLVMNNDINIGTFVAAEILVLFVVDAMVKIIELYETAYDLLTATEKLGQVADLPLEAEKGIRVEEFAATGPFALTLKQVTYTYADAARPSLHNISLEIPAGSRVALAGYNSSGKSTLMQIISLLKRDFTGTLLFNGLPSENLHLRSLRHHIGDLSSQEDIFRGTLRENITLGNPTIPLQAVLGLIEQVGLSKFMEDAPGGIETELLPNGKTLPSGIITKILVARALANQPKLLALESPLNNLTLGDRTRITELLTDRAQAWTMVAVTEDPMLAAKCDRVVVLREGEIVFDGTFEALRHTPHYDRIFLMSPEFSLDKTA